MDWAAVIVAAFALITGIYTSRQATLSKKAAKQIEQQKVDAEAYKSAQQINERSVKRLEADIRWLQGQLKETRQELADAHKLREETEARYEEDLKRAKQEWVILEKFFRRRIKTLEDALRDSGVPVPNGDIL